MKGHKNAVLRVRWTEGATGLVSCSADKVSDKLVYCYLSVCLYSKLLFNPFFLDCSFMGC